MKKEFWLVLIFAVYLGLTTKNFGVDFNVYYSTAKEFIGGKTILYPESNKFQTAKFNYPPQSILFYTPFACFSFETAKTIYFWLNILFIFSSVYLLWKTLDGKKLWLLILFLSMVVLFRPVQVGLECGQASIMIFFFYTLAFYLLRKEKNILAGLSLTIPIMLKIYPVIFLLYALIMKKKDLFWSILIYSFFWFGLSILIFGMETNISFFKQVIFLGHSGKWIVAPNHISISALVIKTFGFNSISVIINYCIPVFLLLITIFVGKFKKKEILFGIFVLLTILLSEFAQHHWFIWTIIPLFFLVNKFMQDKKWLKLTGIFILFLMINTVDSMFIVTLIKGIYPKTELLLHFLPILGTLILYIFSFSDGLTELEKWKYNGR